MTLEMSSNELFRRVALDTISVLEIQPIGGAETPLPYPTYAPEAPVVPARGSEV